MYIRFLKFVVSGALIFWLLSSVDIGALREQLAAADWEWAIYSNMLTVVAISLGVWRWQILLGINQLHVGFGTLVNFWLVGHFFNNFLPSNVGGDVVKATMVGRLCGAGSWSHAASSVLVARVIGLFGMFLVLPIGIAFNQDWVFSLNIQIPLLSAFAGLIVLSVLLFSDIGNSLLRRFESTPIIGKILGYIRVLHDSILSYRAAPRSLLLVLVLACAFTLQTGFQIWLLTKMFPDIHIAWTSQIVVFTVVSLMAMVPITINGYGLQEGTFVVLLVSLGMTPGQGLLVALGYRVAALLAGTAGGILFAISGKPARDIERDAGYT